VGRSRASPGREARTAGQTVLAPHCLSTRGEGFDVDSIVAAAADARVTVIVRDLHQRNAARRPQPTAGGARRYRPGSYLFVHCALGKDRTRYGGDHLKRRVLPEVMWDDYLLRIASSGSNVDLSSPIDPTSPRHARAVRVRRRCTQRPLRVIDCFLTPPAKTPRCAIASAAA
jgi:hypothetical protein